MHLADEEEDAQQVRQLTQDEETIKKCRDSNPGRLALQALPLNHRAGLPQTQQRATEPLSVYIWCISPEDTCTISLEKTEQRHNQGHHEGNADGSRRPRKCSTSSVPESTHCTPRGSHFLLMSLVEMKIKGKPIGSRNQGKGTSRSERTWTSCSLPFGPKA